MRGGRESEKRFMFSFLKRQPRPDDILPFPAMKSPVFDTWRFSRATFVKTVISLSLAVSDTLSTQRPRPQSRHQRSPRPSNKAFFNEK